MKRLATFLPLTLLINFSHAQIAEWNNAERFFYQFEFAAAADIYERIILHDAENMNAIKKLSMCYVKLNDFEQAEQWLAKACSSPYTDPKFFKMYAQALASNKKYDKAAEWYARYSYTTSDETTAVFADLNNLIHGFYSDSSRYQIEMLSFNSDRPDFSPAFYKDGIVFCSARENSIDDTYGWGNSSFIDLYHTQFSNTEVISFASSINTSLHEGPAMFSKNYDTLYFTRNNLINGRKSNGIVNFKIFYSVLKNGKWSKAKGIDIVSDDYSSGHPALSADGKLYFVSDMPGGYGGTDLYYTKFENGKWITPVNLGAKVNTIENEGFPFVDDEGTLYFASSGHPGLGGLDIFSVSIDNRSVAKPHNIGYPINSSKDDFGFIIKSNLGYFSSNRGANPQDDNIYSFTINEPLFITANANNESAKIARAFPIVVGESANIAASKK